MTTPRRRSPTLVAIAAAITLLVQAFLGGGWMAAQATAGPRDAFGNILCTAAPSGGGPRGGTHGAYDCDCCLSGCDAGTAIIPEPSGIGPISMAFVLTSSGKQLVDAPVRRHQLQPLNPRAPPA